MHLDLKFLHTRDEPLHEVYYSVRMGQAIAAPAAGWRPWLFLGSGLVSWQAQSAPALLVPVHMCHCSCRRVLFRSREARLSVFVLPPLQACFSCSLCSTSLPCSRT